MSRKYSSHPERLTTVRTSASLTSLRSRLQHQLFSPSMLLHHLLLSEEQHVMNTIGKYTIRSHPVLHVTSLRLLLVL